MGTHHQDAEQAETPREDTAAGAEGGIIIEASWAPKDPRDRLYDENATGEEKTASLIRIIAAFHPVMNVPVLLFDFFKMVGARWTTATLAALFAAIFYLIFG